MKVLIACEFSGVVRRAFAGRGHYALSVDLLPADDDPGYRYTGGIDAHEGHWQGDILDFLGDCDPGEFDLMIAHPPCTYLANSGVRWLYEKNAHGDRVINADRWASMRKAARFFRTLLDAPIPMVAVENPVMHGHAREIVGRGPDQSIQPWMFGHPETKATCLWLRDLPKLVPTDNVKANMAGMAEKDRQRVFYASPSPDRWKERSVTLTGIADAMADQWGGQP